MLRFIGTHLSDFIVLGGFVVVFILMLADFNVRSKRSWVLLIGFVLLGGILFSQAWRRKKLLEEFKEREKALDDLKDRYDKLKKESEITGEQFELAKKQLAEKKFEAGKEIMQADQELAQKLEEIESQFVDVTPEESVSLMKKALGL